MDAFRNAKPCIALRTPLFEEYFETMGNIGYLCQDLDEMRQVISRVTSRFPADEYLAQQRAIVTAHQGVHSQSVSGDSLTS